MYKIFSYHVKAVNYFLVLVGFSPFILDYEHFYAMQPTLTFLLSRLANYEEIKIMAMDENLAVTTITDILKCTRIDSSESVKCCCKYKDM